MKETKFKQTDIGLIPEDWEAKNLADVGPIRMCKRIMKYQTNDTGDIPFYKIGTFGKKADAFIAKELYNEFRKKYNYPQKGDILLSAAGTIGRTVVFDGEPAYFQDSNIVWIENKENLVINHLLYYIYHRINWITDTGTIPRIYNGNVRSILFSLPPVIEEQKRIANALSQMDDLIAALDEQIEKKKLIKQGAMQQLLTGKTRLKGFSGEWEIVKLGDVAEMNSGGTPSSRNPHYYGGMINFLSISDMTNSGKFIFSTEKTITQLGLDNSSAREFPAGTLMYAMYASLGKCSITKINTAVSQAILGFKLSKRMDRDFLYYYFCFIEESVKKMGQTGTQSNLSKKIVEDFEIYVSKDISEQQAIASTLSTMDEEIQTLQEERDKYALVKQGMMQQLLTGKIRLN